MFKMIYSMLSVVYTQHNIKWSYLVQISNIRYSIRYLILENFDFTTQYMYKSLKKFSKIYLTRNEISSYHSFLKVFILTLVTGLKRFWNDPNLPILNHQWYKFNQVFNNHDIWYAELNLDFIWDINFNFATCYSHEGLKNDSNEITLHHKYKMAHP